MTNRVLAFLGYALATASGLFFVSGVAVLAGGKG